MRLTSDQLSIYLHDHLAGATFGVELARRARHNNQGSPCGVFLGELAQEIQEDREELEAMMRRLQVGRDELKTLCAWAGEKLGRLKLNGRLGAYSPLGRVLELEGLTAGVQGKLSLWQNLRSLTPQEPALDTKALDRLIERAESQLERLREHRATAALEAFAER